jgi:protein-S-isoprenylcysteine O-methyltransferase Ste14
MLWIVLAVMIVVQVIRARREAQVLEAAFGDAYRQYRSKTWF